MSSYNFKVYRLGPIAAFDSSAHSIHQITLSACMAKAGVESYIYLRSIAPKKGRNELMHFLGIELPENLHILLTPKHKGFSSALNFGALIRDLIKNFGKENWVFLSKASHVIKLSRLKKLLGFKIVFENHQNKPFTKAVEGADLTYVVSPEVYKKVKGKGNVKLWTYHHPVREELLSIQPQLKEKPTYTLGYVGSLNPEKGIGFLLRALKELPATLKIIGGGEKQVKRLKKHIESLGLNGKVQITGFIPQNRIAQELKGVDVLVAPFTREQKTIPLKVYEYLATGIPTLSSNIEPVKVVAGDIFYYFEPENFTSFVKAFKELTSNWREAEKRSRKAKEISKGFTCRGVAERVFKDLTES